MPCDYNKIRGDNIKEYGEGTRHLSFLGRLYTDRTHFIFELLQNAEDAGASRILFHLFKDKLEVAHNGRPFNERDVRGVSGVGEGTKAEDLTQIGKFGIGFKSVYAYTSTPEVHSGDEHFRIEHYVRPYQAAAKVTGDLWTTLFVFFFDNPNLEPETASHEITTRLRNLSARTLLFLRKIKEIDYKLPDGTNGVYLREEVPRGPARRVTVIGQNNGEDEDEDWLVFERYVKVPNPPEGCPDSVPIEIAFLLKTNEKDQTEGITKIKDSPLVVSFPTEKPTRFGFLIQGPYKTTPSRDNIPKGDDWNTALIGETAILLTEALRYLKEMGLLTVALLEALPIRMDDFLEDGMFYPIVVSVRDTLMNEDLLPSDDGDFVSAVNAKLASAEWLRLLLKEKQLRELFETDKPMKWISGEISEKTRHDLWKYIREELKVEEIAPETLARKIEVEFLNKQSDDWVVEFYAQLKNNNALWKAGSNYYWDKAGPLRSKKFIRLQDGSHVKPFRNDGSPNAYLTDGLDIETSLRIVKPEITQHEDAFKFLKELKLPELDIVEEVIEEILPRYASNSSKVPIGAHRRHLIKIELAYKTDSQEKKQRLKERLQMVPFVLAERSEPGIETEEYRKPTELHIRNDELMAYFSGNTEIRFVWKDYSKPMLEIFRELGASDNIRIICKSLPGSVEFVPLEYKSGYRRGLRGFDPDIQVGGLEHALKNITIQKSTIIWNKIAVQYSRGIRGKILRSSRQDFSPNASTHKEEETLSKFGQFLTDSSWLPDRKGNFHKPSDLSLNDLPEEFIPNEKLADQLGMRKDIFAKLAEEAGIPTEDIDLLRKYPEEFNQWKVMVSAKKEDSIFPTGPSADPERREQKIIEKYKEATEKKYEKVTQSTKTTGNSIDPKTWLNEKYENDAGELICQICKKEMPFKKRDGHYYFEAIEIINDFDREMEELHIALCPLCAAMYNEFVKLDERAMNELKYALKGSNEPEVSLNLGNLKTSIRFREDHYQDIKTILGTQE